MLFLSNMCVNRFLKNGRVVISNTLYEDSAISVESDEKGSNVCF